MIEITPVLDSKNGEPLYLQLANYIKQEILQKDLKSGLYLTILSAINMAYL